MNFRPTSLIVHVAVLVHGAAQQGVQLVVLHVDGQLAALLVLQARDGPDGLRTHERNSVRVCVCVCVCDCVCVWREGGRECMASGGADGAHSELVP